MATGEYVPHAPGYVDSPGTKVITKRFTYDDSYTLDRYLGTGGYAGLRRALAVSYTHLTLPTTLPRCSSRWSP